MHHIVRFFHTDFRYSEHDKVCNMWRWLECLEDLSSTLLSQQSRVFLAGEGAQRDSLCAQMCAVIYRTC